MARDRSDRGPQQCTGGRRVVNGRSGLRVLVVDDSAYSRREITRMPDASPCVAAVDWARDGEEALRADARAVRSARGCRSCYSFGVGDPGRYFRSLLAASLALGVAGCGYHVVGRAAAGAGVRRVSVETFTNDSMEPGVEFLVADSLRRELLARGGYRLLADGSGADVVIRGTVRPIATSSQSISSIVLAIEHTLTLTLDVRFDTPGGAQRGGAGVFRESELYQASADVEVARTHREEALRRLASILAARVQDALESELRP